MRSIIGETYQSYLRTSLVIFFIIFQCNYIHQLWRCCTLTHPDERRATREFGQSRKKNIFLGRSLVKSLYPSGTRLLCHWRCKVLDEIPIGITNVRDNSAKSVKERPSWAGKHWETWVMSVVSDKQRQAGSGSAPATPQGNLPPAVPPPSISRNPLRGSKCNSLHCDYLYLLPYLLHFRIPALDYSL